MMVDYVRSPLDEVLSVFPNASVEYVQKLLASLPSAQDCIATMAEKGYDRRSKAGTESERDYTSISWVTSEAYRSNAQIQLQRDFPNLKTEGMKKLLASVKANYHYFATVRLIEDTLKLQAHTYPDPVRPLSAQVVSAMEAGLATLGLKPKSSVSAAPQISEWDPVFSAELRWLQRIKDKDRLERDKQLAEELNDKLAEASGALIECGCCYSEFAFENMVCCSDGHLFCKRCINAWVSQRVFGDGKSSVKCMNTTENCQGHFPESMLRSALPEQVFAKLEEALAADAVKAAQLEIVKCFSCSLGAEMGDDAGFILRCVRCFKETCKLCNEEAHCPLKCSEVEKGGAKDVRVQVEEAMTKARVRECHKCKARFYKTEGCNKMACTCGAFICYICRADISKEMYKHFCQVPHCTHKTCGMCVLFTDSVTDDRKAMYEAGLSTSRNIGAQDDGSTIDMNSLLEGGVPVAKKGKSGEDVDDLMWAPARPPMPGGGGIPMPFPGMGVQAGLAALAAQQLRAAILLPAPPPRQRGRNRRRG